MDFKAYTSSHSKLLLTLLTIVQTWLCFVDSGNHVTHLPGHNGTLPFHLETGYVSVDEVSGSQMFYYFVESEKNPNVDPLLLWLTGGPGCSAFTALAAEIGPLKFKIVPYNISEQILPEFVSNPYSWTKLSSIIFLDWPVGSGFSFSPTSQNYRSDDSHSSDEIYRFIRKWFMDHPHFVSNPFYVAGDSYGGKIVPIVAERLAEGNSAGQQLVVNLKGYIVGNPVNDDEKEYESMVTYGFGAGIISHKMLLEIRKNCAGENYIHRKKPACAASLDIFDKLVNPMASGSRHGGNVQHDTELEGTQCLKEFSMENILDPACPTDFDAWAHKDSIPYLRSSYFLEGKYAKVMDSPPIPDSSCPNYVHYLSYYWVNNLASRDALHIKEGTVFEWLRCNSNLAYKVSMKSTTRYHLNITSKGYRALVYSGDHDMIVPYISTLKWIKSLNYTVRDKWRSWHVDGQVAGYTELYSNNLTFATVKGGSHTAPTNMPKQCFAMFEKWISGKTL